MEGLVFGWRTSVLGVVVLQALVLAIGLMRVLPNRAANRTLAGLLIVLAGVLTPWMIGFAGLYDRWRGLTFAPFSITLAVAPLFWLYVQALTSGRWPKKGWRHLFPAGLQFGFLAVSFLLPPPLKAHWADLVYTPFLACTALGAAAGLAVYGVAGLRTLASYRRGLAQQRSDDARFAAAWLSRATVSMLLLLPVWGAYAVWDAIAPLGYVRLMGLYLAIGAFTLYFGVEGWRHATTPFPVLTDDPAPAASVGPARDWRRLGEGWAAEVRAEGWAREPDLSLALLARRLGTNTTYLSRALNEGLGVSFSAFVNGLRSEAVAAALDERDERDLLEIAFDAGFASKASFNRAFRARFGESPSIYRRRASHRENPASHPGDEARETQGSPNLAA